MKTMKKAFAIITLALLAAIIGGVHNSAYAETTVTDDQLARRNTIMKKAVLQGIWGCANAKYMMWEVTLDSGLYRVGGWNGEAGTGDTSDPKKYYLPSDKDGTMFNSVYSAKDRLGTKYRNIVNCDDLIRGTARTQGKSGFDAVGKSKPTSKAAYGQWLTKDAGYFKNAASSDGSSSECYSARYVRTFTDKNTSSVAGTDLVDTQSLCVEYGSDGKAVNGTVPRADGKMWNDSVMVRFYYASDTGQFVLETGSDTGLTRATRWYIPVKGKTKNEVSQNIKKELTSNSSLTWNSQKTCNEGAMGASADYCRGNADENVTVVGSKTEISEATKSAGIVKKSKTDSSALTAVSYSLTGKGWNNGYVGYRVVAALTGYDVEHAKAADATDMGSYAIKKMHLTNTERIQLYMLYFDRMMGANVSCSVEEGMKENYVSSGLGPLNWPVGKKINTDCYATVDHKGKEKGYHGLTAAHGSYFKFSKDATESFDTLLAFFKNLDPNTPLDFDTEATPYTDVNPGDPEEMQKASEDDKQLRESEKTKTCYDTAGSSNWIACPIIDNSSIATNTLYKYIENMLQVNTELFTTGKSTSGTFTAWESFRNIANIAFIIVFIIVILSQITGFGVDNYGIKKILPKLILGALLVNVSFYVCQACIDVANITGGGIKGLLQSAANNIRGSKELQFQFDKMNAVKVGTTISVATIAIAIIGAAVYVSGGAVLVPLLLCAVGVAIGLVFFLVLLAVRQGLAVILVVISPMAFVAYMLPNTKSLFSKWLKFFSGTLLAYPICSLVLYGGELTSRIMLVAASNPDSGMITNFGLSVTSAILSIAPVFFIPTMITKSMGGIAAISGRLKNGLTTMAKGATQRSGLSQGIEENAKGIKYRRAGKWIRGHQGKNAPTSGMGRAKMRRSMAAVDAYERESAKMYETQAAGLGLDGLREMAVSAIDANGRLDAEKFNAAFESAYAKDPEGAWKLFEEFTNAKGEDGKNIYENLKKNDPTGFAKMNNTLARNGGVIGKAILKENNAPNTNTLLTLKELFDRGKIAGRIHDMGEDVVSSMTKDDFKVIGRMSGGNVDGYFTDTQLQRGMAASMSGSDNAAFRENIIGKLSTDMAKRVITGMTVEEWANTENAKLQALYTQAFSSTSASGKVGTTGATFTSYEDFNKMKARELLNSGNTELANKLRADQMAAWNAIAGSRGTFSDGAGI